MKTFTALFIILMIIFSASSAMAETASSNLSAFERVMKNRVIQCGYILYEPVVMKDPNTGKMSGIMVDIMEEIGRRLGMKVEWTVESTYATYSEDIKRPNVDLMCSTFWGGVDVGQFGVTSIPLWYSGLGIFVRSDDNRFNKDINLLNDPSITVASVDGTIPAEIAMAYFPMAKVSSAPAISDYMLSLMDVATKKADVTFMEVSQAAGFLKKNPNQIKNLVPDNPLRVYPNSVLVSVGQNDMLNFMNMALTDLQAMGFIDQLITKYEPTPGAFYRVAKPYMTYQDKHE